MYSTVIFIVPHVQPQNKGTQLRPLLCLTATGCDSDCQCLVYCLRPAGASLCATEDGRRLYLFGGHDGSGPLNDCYYLEVEQLLWSATQPAGTPPEPREGHMAAVLGRYLFVSGGCGVTTAAAAPGTQGAQAAAGSAAGSAAAAGSSLLGQSSAAESLHSTAAAGVGKESLAGGTSQAAAGGAAAAAAGSGVPQGVIVPKRLTDTFVLDMYSGPCWEQLHAGSSVNAMWLKQVGQHGLAVGGMLSSGCYEPCICVLRTAKRFGRLISCRRVYDRAGVLMCATPQWAFNPNGMGATPQIHRKGLPW